jgi:hypothetical protein
MTFGIPVSDRTRGANGERTCMSPGYKILGLVFLLVGLIIAFTMMAELWRSMTAGWPTSCCPLCIERAVSGRAQPSGRRISSDARTYMLVPASRVMEKPQFMAMKIARVAPRTESAPFIPQAHGTRSG